MTSLRLRVLARVRGAIAAHLNRSERGITFVMFALAIVVILGMVALGIDGGRLYDERRQAQNAADHAALAAAYASCANNDPDPDVVAAAAVAAGLASADTNGYDDNGTTNDVTITVVDADENQYDARVDTTIDTTFAKLMGFAAMDTFGFAQARATGCDAVGGGVPAVHAGGIDCPGGSLRNVEISGNDHTVNGLTRSNGSFYNGGNDSEFTNSPGPAVEYVGSFTGGGSNNTYLAAEDQVSLPPVEDRWPDGFDPNPTTGDMTDAMWLAYKAAAIARGQINMTPSSFNITGNGVYYTERTGGDIEVTSIANGAEFVVVSKFRPIKIPNDLSGRTFHAYGNNPVGTPDNVILVSGFSHSQPCDQFAFERSGEGGTWNGIFWTPRAMSRWSGNFGTINGGFVTWAFQMNGNNHTINGGTGGPAEDPDYLLTE